MLVAGKKNLTDVAIHFAGRGHPHAGAKAGEAVLAEIEVLTYFVARVSCNNVPSEDATNTALACIERLRRLAEALRDSR